MSKKVLKYVSIALAVIGMILIASGPVVGVVNEKITLLDEKGKTVHDDSMSFMNSTYAFSFTLEKNQKIDVEMSVDLENITVHIIFVEKSEYLDDLEVNGAPNAGDGLQMLYASYDDFVVGEPITRHSSTQRTLVMGSYYYMEFMGGYTGNVLYSIPNDYVVLIWGDNSWGSNSTLGKHAYFDIKVIIDGPGQEAGIIFYLIGGGVICVAIVIALIYSKKKRT
jgi:hypothetical protein